MDQELYQKPNEESEPSNEEFTDNDPVVVFDGICKHYWVDEGIDGDGHGNAKCKKCPMGKTFKVEEWEVKNGRIVAR